MKTITRILIWPNPVHGDKDEWWFFLYDPPWPVILLFITFGMMFFYPPSILWFVGFFEWLM